MPSYQRVTCLNSENLLFASFKKNNLNCLINKYKFFIDFSSQILVTITTNKLMTLNKKN